MLITHGLRKKDAIVLDAEDDNIGGARPDNLLSTVGAGDTVIQVLIDHDGFEVEVLPQVRGDIQDRLRRRYFVVAQTRDGG
jgi:hypothetical protein